MTPGGPTAQNIANPVYLEMARQLSEKETKIASLRRRLVSAEEDRDKIEDEARRAPSVGAEYLNLDRDYEVVKKNYTELLARRESAQIAENADKKGDKIDIKTIDTPEVPTLPSSPNRPLFLSMVLVAGLGAGVGVAFVLSQIDSSYSTTTALRDSLGLPDLGQHFGHQLVRPAPALLVPQRQDAFAARGGDAGGDLWRIAACLCRPAP